MKHPIFNRIMSLLLTLAMLTTSAPLQVFPLFMGSYASQMEQVEENEQTEQHESEASGDPSSRPVIYDALWVEVDGEVKTSISILTHEKVAIKAIGLEEAATYQWQILHPEKDDLWVDIYDGTSPELSVTYALVGNMMTDENAATLRCRAYTEDYAYLSHYFTVNLQETQSSPGSSGASAASSGQGTNPLAKASGEPPEFVTVTIRYEKWEYLYDSVTTKYVLTYMGPAFSSYVATLKYNGSLNTTVANPTIMGYAPYLGDATESTPGVEINLTNITEDVVITVNYKPAKVKYEVHYYFQNIYDDLYTEDETIAKHFEGEGTTGLPPVDGVGEQVKGFTALYYQPDTIAADGSTVFDVFYERNYYLMEFDCDGGYGVHAIYVRHGTYVSVATPIKPGYVFDKGWDLIQTDESGSKVDCADGAADEIPSVMPTHNTAYKALWTTTMTTYTVVYWINNSDGTKTFYGSRPVDEMSATLVSGSNDLVASMNVCGLEAHTHNGSCGFSCGKTEHTHTAACCDITAHTHGDGACTYDCGKTYHDHTSGCVYNCGLNEHMAHQRSCYNFTAATVNENATTFNWWQQPTKLNNTYNGFEVYYTGNGGNRTYYVLINGSYYQISGYGNQLDANDLTFTYTCHTHSSACCTLEEHTHTNCTCTKTEHAHNTGACNYACGLTNHTHGASCYGCKQNEHTHTDDCKASLAPYLEYVEAETDKNVIVEGDGSTVVNVYYKKKIFEIRFIYARSYVNNGNTIYQVADTTNSGVVGGWGLQQVRSLPTVKAGSGFTPKSEVIDGYTYYYIALRAEFGANIEALWPGDAINDVTDTSDRVRRFGSWGAEAGTPYRSDDPDHANIVGPYPYMSAEMIHPANYNTPITENGETYYLAQRMSAWWGTRDKLNFGGWDHGPIDNHTYHIYVESLGSTGDRYYDGKWYDLVATHNFYAAHNGSTRVDPFYYNGFECVNDTREHGYNHTYDYQKNSVNYQKGSTAKDEEGHPLYDCPDNSCEYCNCFYYGRADNTLTFFNYNASSNTFPSQIMKFEEKVMDGLPVSAVAPLYKPPYPEGIEPNAYVFEGWFTSSGCYPGTEVDWEKLKMPDGDLTLYAKWTPVVRDVTFHLLYTDVDKGIYWQPSDKPEDQITYPIKVPHGELLGTTYNHIPSRGDDYQFVGWFYFDENGKKKFAPDSMKVVRNLELFAEWYSTVPTTYEVKYEAWDEKTTTLIDAEIAKPTEGYSTAGKTTTFNAKGGAALYDKSSAGGTNYQSQWFPEHSSHSILMDENSSKNVHTFRYFHKEYINYKVVYVDRSTGAILGESEVKQTKNAIVTEKFRPFDDYLPENYYIEKAIAYDPTDYNEPGKKNHVQPENIIYFYYNPDQTHDPFRIEHWYQNLDGTYTLTYTEQGIADNGVLVTATPRKPTGYVHVQAKAEVITYQKNAEGQWVKNEPIMGKLEGKVSEHGLEIKLYYDRITVEYTIKYVCTNPSVELEIIDDQSGVFGSTITHTAPDKITKGSQTYIYFDPNDKERTKSIVIRENAEDNVITFYYNLKQIAVHYHVVCTVPDLDKLNGVSTAMQLITALDDSVHCTAMPGTGFEFKGWYYDEACKQPVPDSWIKADGLTIYPQDIIEDPDGTEHFYAKFEPRYGKITITKSFSGGNGVISDNFLFRVKGLNHNNQHIDLIVSITGTGTLIIENVAIGDYEVTELTAWSYEYTVGEAIVSGKVEEGSTVDFVFVNTYDPSKWLGGEASVNNRFS